MRYALVLTLLACSACGYFRRDQEPKEPVATEAPQALLDTGSLYCQLSRPAYQAKGYVHSRCDGAGFTSLYAIGCEGVDLSVFTDEDGKLWRSHGRDCFANGDSKSESSRDMWMMRMIAAWEQQDLAWVNQAIAFGEANNWVICEAIDQAYKIGRCTMSPTLYGLLYDMRSRLKGQTLSLTRDSDDGLPEHHDFEAHLDVLRIYLSGEVKGGITKAEKSLLEIYAKREPKNALFLAVWHRYSDGDQSETYAVLGLFPQDRLPNDRDDWCTEYLFQRDMLKDGEPNGDWKPCPAVTIAEHSGTDFNLALHIARKPVS